MPRHPNHQLRQDRLDAICRFLAVEQIAPAINLSRLISLKSYADIYPILRRIQADGFVRNHAVLLSPTHQQLLWSLSELGIAHAATLTTLNERGRLFRTSDFSAMRYNHRITLQAMRLAFLEKFPTADWQREPLLDDKKSTARPDAIATISLQKASGEITQERWAIELELSAKTAKKYQSVFAAHDAGIDKFYQFVFYVCQNPALKKFILTRITASSRYPGQYYVGLLPQVQQGQARTWPPPSFWFAHDTTIWARPEVPLRPPTRRIVPRTSVPCAPCLTLQDGSKIVLFVGGNGGREFLWSPGIIPAGERDPHIGLAEWQPFFNENDQEFFLPAEFLGNWLEDQGGLSPDSEFTFDEIVSLPCEDQD